MENGSKFLCNVSSAEGGSTMGTSLLTVETNSRDERFEADALIHMDSVYRSALYMAGNESDAQDLVQDTYLRAYKFFDKFEEGTNCKAWLLKILRNTFINTIRHSSRQLKVVHLADMEDRGLELSSNVNAEDGISGNLLDDEIVDAMNELPLEYRTAVLLADIEMLPYKEIADIISCPIGTVMSRLHRGRKLLKKSLGNYAIQYGYAKSQNVAPMAI